MSTSRQAPSLNEPARFSVSEALRLHGDKFLIEAWALGMFMLSASVVTTLLEAPGAPLLKAIPNPLLRTALIGLAMGSTAVALIYSPWGQRTGAHMNPAVTLAFFSLRRISTVNAVLYAVAQFAGGTLGVLLSRALLGSVFALPPLSYIVTVPGAAGAAAAFVAELAISFGMMFAILVVSNNPRWVRYTGFVAGFLIVNYVTFESSLSGFSMNPARTLGSALPAGIYTDLWIYFVAPCSGMFLAGRAFHALTPWVERRHHLAKLLPTHESPPMSQTTPNDPSQRSDEEWKQSLNPETFAVMRKHGTERAGSSPLNHEHRQGRYACAACGLPLFQSDAKFESGTGWPSFFAPLPQAVATTTDRSFGMARTEVHCARCGGHLGHVFPDGPMPTGQRYCMNGVSLKFEPA